MAWLFDCTVAIRQIDEGLVVELNRLAKLHDGDKWRPQKDEFPKSDLYEKYERELYGHSNNKHHHNHNLLE